MTTNLDQLADGLCERLELGRPTRRRLRRLATPGQPQEVAIGRQRLVAQIRLGLALGRRPGDRLAEAAAIWRSSARA